MKKAVLYQHVALCALGSALTLAGMLAVAYWFGGTSQQTFERVMPAEAYARALVSADLPLRIILALDNLFILLYTPVFLLLGTALYRKRTRYLTAAATLLLVAVAVLDFLENHHIQVMIDSVQAGIPLVQADISERAQQSMLKFHSSYLGLFLFSFVLPSQTPLERILIWGIRLALVPAGILLYVVPGAGGRILELLRYGGMFFGFALLAYNYFVRSRGRHLVYE